METILILIVVALAVPLLVFSAPVLAVAVPLIVLGLVISYFWHRHDQGPRASRH